MDRLRLVNHLNTTLGQNTHTSDEPQRHSDGRFTVATSLREVNILTVQPPTPPTHERALSLESQGLTVARRLLITSAPWDNGMLLLFSVPINSCLCLYSDTVYQPVGRVPAGAEHLRSALWEMQGKGVWVGKNNVCILIIYNQRPCCCWVSCFCCAGSFLFLLPPLFSVFSFSSFFSTGSLVRSPRL